MNSSSKPDLTNMVESYTDDMYSWAYHKVSDVELAKDLVQDTFLAAAEKLDSFRGASSPKTWLFSILNHKIIDAYRKQGKQAVKMDSQLLEQLFTEDGSWKNINKYDNWQVDDQHLLDNSEFIETLSKCLDALPEKWSTCVKLRFLSSKKGEEICQEMGITPTNFWQIVHRAKLQLRDCLEKKWFKI